MKKQIIKLNLRVLAKMLVGILLFVASILVTVVGKTGMQKEDAIITVIFFGVFCFCVIIAQFFVLINGSKQVKKYLKEGKYTENQLELEYANSNNISRKVRIGDVHLFISDYNGVYIIPLRAIERMSVRETGNFDKKVRRAYYALYITPSIWHTDIRVLFLTRKKAEETLKQIEAKMNKEDGLSA